MTYNFNSEAFFNVARIWILIGLFVYPIIIFPYCKTNDPELMRKKQRLELPVFYISFLIQVLAWPIMMAYIIQVVHFKKDDT